MDLPIIAPFPPKLVLSCSLIYFCARENLQCYLSKKKKKKNRKLKNLRKKPPGAVESLSPGPAAGSPEKTGDLSFRQSRGGPQFRQVVWSLRRSLISTTQHQATPNGATTPGQGQSWGALAHGRTVVSHRPGAWPCLSSAPRHPTRQDEPGDGGAAVRTWPAARTHVAPIPQTGVHRFLS